MFDFKFDGVGVCFNLHAPCVACTRQTAKATITDLWEGTDVEMSGLDMEIDLNDALAQSSGLLHATEILVQALPTLPSGICTPQLR